MDYANQSSSVVSDKETAKETPKKQILRGQSSMFSTGSPLSVISRQNSTADQDYVLNECQKLILKGRYSKAFINLRRHLMNAEVQYHLRPMFYSQLVHSSLKLIEKYLTKPLTKIQQKVPPFLQICYSYLEKWEQYLTELQFDTSPSQNNSQKFSSSWQKQESSSSLIESQEDLAMPYHLQPKARANASPKRNAKKSPSSNRLPPKQAQLEELSPEKGQFPAGFQEAFQMQQSIEEIGLVGLQNVQDQFHLHRELFLSYLLKTMFSSYRYQKLENHPPKALAYLTRGSEIVRNFLCNFLFVSSAELSRIAAKIEVTLGNIYMELGRKQEAIKYYQTAYEMSRNAVEVWVKKIGSYNSEKDVPQRAEIRCEKQIKEFLAVLFAKSSCEESLSLYVKAIDTMGLADWVAHQLLPADSPLRDDVSIYYQEISCRYSKELEEEGEVDRILRSLYQKKVNLVELKESEEESKQEKQLAELDKYFYEKANCEELNKNLTVLTRNKVDNQQEESSSNPVILARSSFSKTEINAISKKAKVISKNPFGLEIKPFDENYHSKQQFPQSCKASWMNTSTQDHSLHDQTTQIGGQSYLSPGTSFVGHMQGKVNLNQSNQSFSATGLQTTADNTNNNISSHYRFNSFSQASLVSTKNVEHLITANPSMPNIVQSEQEIQSNLSQLTIPKSTPNIESDHVQHGQSTVKNSLETEEATTKNNPGINSIHQSRQYLNIARIASPISANSTKKQRKLLSQSHHLISSTADISRRSSFQQGCVSRPSISLATANKSKEAYKKKLHEHGKKKKMEITDIFKEEDNPPKYEVDQVKLEQLKQKFRYMRDSQKDKEEEKHNNNFAYKYMKIPLEERTDLMDLDVCMKKLIKSSLAKQSQPSSYPEVYLEIDKKLENEGIEKKTFQFASNMVGFNKQYGNGHSISALIGSNDRQEIPTIQTELHHHKQGLKIASLNEMNQQKKEQLLDQAQNQQKGNISSFQSSEIEAGLTRKFRDIVSAHGNNKILQQFLGSRMGSGVGVGSTPIARQSQNSSKQTSYSVQNSSYNTNRLDEKSNLNFNGEKAETKNISISSAKQPRQQQQQQNLYGSRNAPNRLSSASLVTSPELQVEFDNSLTFNHPNSKNAAYINIKQNVLSNEHERENLLKQIYSVRFRGKRLSTHELVANLAEQDKQNQKPKQPAISPDEQFIKSMYAELGISPERSPQEIQMNSSQYLNLKHCRSSLTLEQQPKEKQRSEPSGCSINPKYFSLDQYYRENSELLTYHVKKENGQASFDMDRFTDLAASTKNMQQLRLFKQNPFSVQSLSIFNKLKRKEDGGTSKNAGEASNKSNTNKALSQSTYSLPRRLSLFFQNKRE